MTLIEPESNAARPMPPLPTDWAANYAQATHRMNCADPLDSDLLIYPENRVPHGGGMLIMPTGPEATLIEHVGHRAVIRRAMRGRFACACWRSPCC